MMNNVWMIGIGALAAEHAFAGGWTSGGGNYFTDEGNSWFLGDDPIEYCITRDPGFPLSETEVDEAIQYAFQEWQSVFKKYGLYRTPLAGKFKDLQKRAITTDVVRVPFCANSQHQLEFKIGILDQSIQEHFKVNTKATLGFAQRKDYDHKTYRTGGMIWIAPQYWIDPKEFPVFFTAFPNWRASHAFKDMLIHEIGHVLGVPHFYGSLMSEDIIQVVSLISHGSVIGGVPNWMRGRLETETFQFNPFLGVHTYKTRPEKGETPFCEMFATELGLDPGKPAADQCREEYRFHNGGIREGHHLELKLTTTHGKTLAESIELRPKGVYTEAVLRFQSPGYKPRFDYEDQMTEAVFKFYGHTSSIGLTTIAGKQVFFQIDFDSDLWIRLLRTDLPEWKWWQYRP